MAGMRDILNQMADVVRGTIAGVLDDDNLAVQVEPRMILEPTPLTIDIYPGDPARDSESAAFDDIDGGYLFTVRARINTPDFDAAYDILLSLMDDDDPLCLAAAILDEPTLNGYASSVHVQDQSGLRAYEHPSGKGAHLGFQLTANVIAAHS